MHDAFDRSEALLDDLQPVAELLAAGAAVDWDATDAYELTDSHKALLAKLRQISLIATAHASAGGDEGEADAGGAPPPGGLHAWGSLIVREYLGRGSFGDVYRAWDPRLDREVALKLLTQADEADRGSQVISEGRALARVRHPNVVTVYGADRINGRIGVWMEFVEGQTLAERIASEGVMGAAEVLTLGADLARALSAVHKAGLLHRDVKAQNVMCETAGRIVLTDFGTAVLHDEPGAAPDAGRVTSHRAALAGTPPYLSQEVLRGAPQTIQSDIYALGVLLFYALTGTFPVTGQTFNEIKRRHEQGRVARLSDLRADVPAPLARIVGRALAVDPAARFQTADEMAVALDTVGRQLLTQRAAVATTAPLALNGTLSTAGLDTAPPPAVALPRPWLIPAIALGQVAAMALVAWLGGVLPYRGIAREVPFKGPDFVLIASFENTSGDATLGPKVEQAVAEAVGRVRRFTIVPTERVNEVRGFMRRAPDSPLDATAAREAALRDGGVRAVVTGTIGGTGDRPSIEVRVVAPSSGRNIATIKEASAGGDLAKLLDAVRNGIAEALSERQNALPAPTADYEHVTTSSFEALRAYTVGRTAFEAGNPTQALNDFRRAIEVDPGFALAHTWAGWSLPWPESAPFFQKGDELAGTASPAERLWARSSFLVTLHDDPDARNASAQVNWELLQLDPLHYWALNNLDLVLRDNIAEYPKVVPLWERQAAARPDDTRVQFRTALALLVVEGQVGRAWGYFDRFLELTKDTPEGGEITFRRVFARLAPAWDAWARGRPAEAVRFMESTCDAPGGGPQTQLTMHNECIRLAGALGRLRRADAHASAVLAQPQRGALLPRLIPALLRDDRNALRDIYDAGPRDPIIAMTISSRLEIPYDAGTMADRKVFRGISFRQIDDLANGPSPETLQAFAELWRMRPMASGGFYPDVGPPRFAVLYANALFRTGDSERALTVLRSAIPDRRATITDRAAFGWITLVDAYGDLLRRLGRGAEAEPVERELLQLLSEADEDHVIAAKLRARYGGSAPAER